MDHLYSHLAEAMGLCLGPKLQRQCWAHYPLASGPLGTLALQLVVLVLLFPHPECLAEAEEASMAGKLSDARFPQAALSLLPLRGGRHGNTEGLGRGSFEPEASGTEPRNPRQAPCQGHNTEGKEPQSLAKKGRLDKPNWSREFISHQTAQTLLSARTMGPQQAAHSTPNPAQQPWS